MKKKGLCLTSVVALVALSLVAATYGSDGADHGIGNVPQMRTVAGRPGGDVASGDASVVAQQGSFGITVSGYGLASADADAAVLEFYFNSNKYPLPVPGQEFSTPSAPDFTPITEEALAPVIDAIVTAGVSRDAIELVNVYSDPYSFMYSSFGTLRVTLHSLDSIGVVRDAAQSAASGLSGIYLGVSNVLYTVDDCSALEQEALAAAVADANERAAAFAQALGVGLGEIIGAANWSYDGGPYDSGSACGGYGGPYPETGYFEGQPSTVSVDANISVTYAIE